MDAFLKRGKNSEKDGIPDILASMTNWYELLISKKRCYSTRRAVLLRKSTCAVTYLTYNIQYSNLAIADEAMIWHAVFIQMCFLLAIFFFERVLSLHSNSSQSATCKKNTFSSYSSQHRMRFLEPLFQPYPILDYNCNGTRTCIMVNASQMITWSLYFLESQSQNSMNFYRSSKW